jgi:sulfur dioxygenase
MLLRQLFDHESYTYTYLLADETSREAALIDPVKEKVELYLQLLDELQLKLVAALDTHVHADHVTALGDLREATSCQTHVGSEQVSCASVIIKADSIITVGNIEIQAIYTPGHTDDSYCFLVDDCGKKIVFTGDTLFIRGTGRTDFQNGSAENLYQSLLGILMQLPDDTIVYPGHDYRGHSQSTIDEEKRYNPRLKYPNRYDFVDMMNNLDLPDPKRIHEAVPANRSCGRLDL